jgi:hypothetical protein
MSLVRYKMREAGTKCRAREASAVLNGHLIWRTFALFAPLRAANAASRFILLRTFLSNARSGRAQRWREAGSQRKHRLLGCASKQESGSAASRAN